MRISVSVATTPSNMSHVMFAGQLERNCAQLARLGFQGVDLFVPDPLTIDIAAVKSVLDACGLTATMLAAAGDIMADGLYLNTPEPSRLSELLERSRRHLDLAARLGAMPNVGFIRGRHADGESRAESLKRMGAGVRAYCELAAEMGVTAIIEPICRYEINSVNTVDQALELCALAGWPDNLGLLLDLFHMNIEEPSLCAAILRAGRHTRHVHFVDNTRAVPGRGCLALADAAACLKAVGYNGFLGVEAITGEDPWRDAAQAVEYTRLLLAD